MVHRTYIEGEGESRPHLHAVKTPPEGTGVPPLPAPPEGSVLSAGDLLIPEGTVVPPGRGEPVEGLLIERKRTRRDTFAVLDGDDPVLPSWLTSGQVRRDTARRWTRRAKRGSVIAVVNAPWLACRLAGWTFRGGYRSARRLARWVADRDGHPGSGKQPATTDKMFEQMAWSHAERVGFRVRLVAVLGGIGTVSVTVPAALAEVGVLPWWPVAGVDATAVVTGIVLLARAGRPKTPKTLTPFARTFVVPTVSCNLVATALREVVPSATAKLLTEHEKDIWGSGFLPIPGGHKVQIIMPGAYRARALIPSEDKLAGGMGRPEDCVIVKPLPRISASHADLYIFDAPVFDGRSTPGPIATAKRTSWWDPMPCGVTRTREVHKERLFGGAWGIGGKPEQGKSELGKAVVAWSILDPIVRVMVFNLKGDAGYAFAKASCHQYVSASPDIDHAAIPQAHRAVKWLLEECGRRNQFLTKLYEAGKITDTEVTEELSRRYPDQLAPITAVFDEIHRAFDPGTYSGADEFKADFAKAVRAVRSVAISLFWLTQLANSESVPTDISGSTRCRVCLKVDNTAFFTQVYGQAGEGVFKALGVIGFPRGVAVMASTEGTPTKIKVFHVTPKLAAIGERAHRLRADLDLLTGEATGAQVATGDITDPADLLRHLLPIIGSTAPTGGPEDEGVAWLSEIESILGSSEPYAGRAPGWLAVELKSRRVRTVDVGRRRGYEDRPSGQRKEIGVTVTSIRDRLAEMIGAA